MIVLWDKGKKLAAEIADELPSSTQIKQASASDEVRRAVEMGPDVLLIGPTISPKEALAFATEVGASSPGVPIVLVRTDPSTALLRAAMRAGIRDIVPPTATAQQLLTIARTLGATKNARSGDTNGTSNGNGDGHPGKLVTVFSTKGGSGKSVVTSNLAILLAQEVGASVAIVDLDLESGDQQIMLQLFDGPTMLDVVQEGASLDADALAARLAMHESGVHLLAAPAEPGGSDSISADDVHRILTLLKSRFRYVVVDGPSSYSEHLLAALDVSDDVVYVTSMDVPSIRAVKVGLTTLNTLGFDPARIHIILNRADSNVGLTTQHVLKAIGHPVNTTMPSSRDVPSSVNRGVPLAVGGGRSKIVAPIAELARSIAGVSAGSNGTKTSFLKRKAKA